MKRYMVSQTDGAHPPDDALLALIHEQPSDDAAAVRGHIESCASCAARVDTLRADDALVGELLGALDHPLGPRLVPDSFAPRRVPLRRRAALLVASAATFAVAAAAMVPASPLHHWLVGPSPATPVASRASAAPTPAQPAAAPSTDASLASGIAVPATSALLVAFRREQDSGAVEIVRTQTGDVTFRSRGGATAYDVKEQQVTIDNQAPAEVYLLEIPVTVRTVRIRIGERTLLRWPEDSARFAIAADPARARVTLNPRPGGVP
jgi:hypothetical protein